MEFALLSGIAEDARRQVLSHARRRRFRRGEVVFHEGDAGDTLHLVTRGRFAVRVTTPLGDVATLLVLGPGGHFGELAIVAPGPRNATVAALDDAETLSLHRDNVIELQRSLPSVATALVDGLVTEIRRLSHQLLEALYLPADQRVLRRLLDLISGDEADAGPVTIPLTQDELAQLAGTTRPTANRVLRDAVDAGLVELHRGRIVVLDQEGLVRRAR